MLSVNYDIPAPGFIHRLRRLFQGIRGNENHARWHDNGNNPCASLSKKFSTKEKQMTIAASTNFEESAKSFLAAAVGSAPVGITPEPAPQLNGLLLQLPGAAPIYLVLNSFRRWIPSPATMAALFVPNPNVIKDIGIGTVSEGPALSANAVLAKADNSERVYLVTNGIKMWIPSPDIFNRYQFNWNKVVTVPSILMESIPNGPDIEGPHA
jgi:hypothetical protein